MTLIKAFTCAFHRFFTVFKKTIRVPFVSCPAVVPDLSHAFSGTGKLLKRGRLALFFPLVPPILQTKVSFWGGLGVDSAPFVAGCGPSCNTKWVHMGSSRPIFRRNKPHKTVLCQSPLGSAFPQSGEARLSVQLLIYSSGQPASPGEAGASTEAVRKQSARQASPHCRPA